MTSQTVADQAIDCVVLLAVVSLVALRVAGREGRRALARAARRVLWRAARAVGRYAVISVWAAWLGMPPRLAVRLQAARWREIAEARGLAGLKRGRVRRTPLGVAIKVTLNGRLDLPTLTGRLGQLETGLGVRRGSIRVEPGEMAHRATLHVVLRDPLRRGVPWRAPQAPVSIRDEAALAMTPFGEWMTVSLRQRILIVGTSGSGKSSVQRVLAAHVVLSGDAELEIWDLKQGTESQHYEGKASLRITTPEACAARIRELVEVELPRRAAILRARRTSTWSPSPETPDRIILVDEGAALIRSLAADDLALLYTLIEQARAYGVFVWWATQFPLSESLPTQVRSQMSAVIALRLTRQSESRVVFEDLVGEGWTPHRLPAAGWLLLKDDDHTDPEPARAAWLPESAFRALPPARVANQVQVVQVAPVATRPTLRVISGGDQVGEITGPEITGPDVDELRAALRAAGPDGVSVGDLMAATGGSRAWVHKWLSTWQADGSVCRVSRGRYRSVDSVPATGTE